MASSAVGSVVLVGTAGISVSMDAAAQLLESDACCMAVPAWLPEGCCPLGCSHQGGKSGTGWGCAATAAVIPMSSWSLSKTTATAAAPDCPSIWISAAWFGSGGLPKTSCESGAPSSETMASVSGVWGGTGSAGGSGLEASGQSTGAADPPPPFRTVSDEKVRPAGGWSAGQCSCRPCSGIGGALGDGSGAAPAAHAMLLACKPSRQATHWSNRQLIDPKNFRWPSRNRKRMATPQITTAYACSKLDGEQGMLVMLKRPFWRADSLL